MSSLPGREVNGESRACYLIIGHIRGVMIFFFSFFTSGLMCNIINRTLTELSDLSSLQRLLDLFKLLFYHQFRGLIKSHQ